ncbi:MAG: polysaccharide deacetylase family protein [Gemmatimonadota bacterium]
MKRWIPGVAGTLIVMGLLTAGAWRLHESRTHQLFGELVPRVETADSLVALTFDDGPTPGFTQDVLGILDRAGTRATFFVVGSDVEANPDEAAALVAAGHELGNHSYAHRHMVGRSPAFVTREITRTDSLIRAAGYAGPIHFRPPYGKRLIVLPWVLSRLDRTTVLWDIEPESYPDVARDPDRIREHVLARVAPGSIILLHPFYEARRPTLEALPRLIEDLRDRGYRPVTVSELLAATATERSDERAP